ncbi:MAG TPA: FkbM family methyltransferase [Candidatus Corynebacterium avicola]|uniref:FkbM family methyltransferase n=1 Tax=Candidatus Corynebacterium avicola TaxID=2838527 RepID=A0A9D1ULN1_9CORY|nr:FkbM family methyltransferase [Candidatus Corynebacterium avicola]
MLGRHAWFVEDEAAHLQAFVPEGGVCIDVGAEFGLYTMLFSEAVGPGGTVVAVEANPSLAQPLSRLMTLAGAGNVEELGAAVMDSDVVEGVNLSVPYRRGLPVWGRSFVTQGSDGVGPNVEFATSREVTVPSTYLDRIVELSALDRVDVVKADIEGAELLMLHGAQRILDEFRPCWMIEIEDRHLRKYGATGGDVVEIFRRAGYTMRRLEKGTWIPCDEVTTENRNYVFIPQEKVGLPT